MNNIFDSFMKTELDNILNEIKKTTEIFDENYIKRLVKNWKIKDFQFNDKGETTNSYAINEFDKILKKFYDSIQGNITFVMLEKSRGEISTTYSNTLCGKALIALTICQAVYNYFSKKINNPDKEISTFANLTMALQDNYKGLVFAYLSRDFLTVIQKTRIIYECYVIFLYIYKHNELAEAFFDHRQIIEYKIVKDISEFDKTKIEKLIEKYGNEFSETLGWTKYVIKEKNKRNLKTLALDVGIDEKMNVLYNMTSNFIHTSAFSTFIENRYIDYVSKYLSIAIDIVIRQLVRYVKKISNDKKDSDFINLFLANLEIELFPEDVIKGE